MRVKVVLLIIIFVVSCSNENESNNNTKVIRSENNPNPNHLTIAKNLLAPCIGEWSYNYSLVTELKDWTLVIKDDSYVLVCNLSDFSSSQLSWAIQSGTGSGGFKINCKCGNGYSGKCMSKSDGNCYPVKDTPCQTTCEKTTTSTIGWNDTYGVDGLAILNTISLPNLIVIYE